MKTPGQAIIQKYNKNKVVIITAYILALSKKSEYDYISNITEKSLAFKYVAWEQSTMNVSTWSQSSSRRQTGAGP